MNKIVSIQFDTKLQVAFILIVKNKATVADSLATIIKLFTARTAKKCRTYSGGAVDKFHDRIWEGN